MFKKSLIGMLFFLLTLPILFSASGQEEDSNDSNTAIYLVRPGDTLWGICRQELGNPYKWKEVWSFNPHITNPHTLNPGEKVFLKSSATAEAKEVKEEVSDSKPDVEVTTPEMMIDKNGSLDKSKTQLFIPIFRRTNRDFRNMVTIAGNRPLVFTPKAATHLVLYRHALLSPEEENGSNKILAKVGEGRHMAEGDTAIALFKNADSAKTGIEFLIYRKTREITHPVNNETLGILTSYIARAKVTRIEGKKLFLTIQETLTSVKPGDYIFAPKNTGRTIFPVPNKVNLKGFVVDTPSPYLRNFHEMQLIFIDKGQTQGVVEGNTLDVTKPIESLKGLDTKTSRIKIARLVVVEANKNTSVCMVTKSLKEFHRGDTFEMKADPRAARKTRTGKIKEAAASLNEEEDE